MPRTFGRVSVNGVNDTDADACGATVARSVSISWPSTDSVTGTSFSGASPLLLRPAVTRDALLARERRARERDRRDREIRRRRGDATDTVLSVMPSGKRASSEPLQPLCWKSLISTASRRLIGERLRMLSASFSAGTVARGARPDLGRVDGRLEPRSVRRRAHVLFGVAGEQHQRGAIVGAESRARRLPRGLARLSPVIAVAHARRLIEQDDHLARAARRGGGHRALLEERPRERQRRSARSPPRAAAAAPSGGSAGGGPTDTECAARTSATGTRSTRFRSR